MNQPADDNSFGPLFQRLKAADQTEIPAFGDVLGRPPWVRPGGTLRRWAIAGGGMAAVLLGLALTLVNWHDRDRQSAGQLSARSGAAQPPSGSDVAKGQRQALNFGELQSSIDQYFEPYLALDYPARANTTASHATSWITPTDSLLAMNLDVFSQE